MARIRKSATPTPTLPPARPARRTTPTSKRISSLPSRLRAHGTFADSKFGNKDGVLDRRELARFTAAYGSQPGYRDGVVRPLQDALGEKVDLEPVTTPGPAASKSLAARLTVAGGSANAADVALVAAQVAQIPAPVLQKMEAAGLKFVVARGSVTDVLTELKGVKPRGWPPGATWDQVPGLYDPKRKAVVIATVASDGGARSVPAKGSLHGAYSLTLHEAAHGLDYRKVLDKKGSSTAAFKAAYEADRASLEKHGETYLLQAGNAGLEEAYAESFARFFAGDPQIGKTMPHLRAYWQGVAAKQGGA